MPPRPLRAVTKKAAALLPQNAKFTFLSDASCALSEAAPQLATILGRQALLTADNPSASVARRAALQLCSTCGVHLNPHTIASIEVRPLSKRTVRRAAAAAAAAAQQGHASNVPRNVVAVIRKCKVCGHENAQPFVSQAAAQQAAVADSKALEQVLQGSTAGASATQLQAPCTGELPPTCEQPQPAPAAQAMPEDKAAPAQPSDQHSAPKLYPRVWPEQQAQLQQAAASRIEQAEAVEEASSDASALKAAPHVEPMPACPVIAAEGPGSSTADEHMHVDAESLEERLMQTVDVHRLDATTADATESISEGPVLQPAAHQSYVQPMPAGRGGNKADSEVRQPAQPLQEQADAGLGRQDTAVPAPAAGAAPAEDRTAKGPKRQAATAMQTAASAGNQGATLPKPAEAPEQQHVTTAVGIGSHQKLEEGLHERGAPAEGQVAGPGGVEEMEEVFGGDLYARGMLGLRHGFHPGRYAYSHHPWYTRKRLRLTAVGYTRQKLWRQGKVEEGEA